MKLQPFLERYIIEDATTSRMTEKLASASYTELMAATETAVSVSFVEHARSIITNTSLICHRTDRTYTKRHTTSSFFTDCRFSSNICEEATLLSSIFNVEPSRCRNINFNICLCCFQFWKIRIKNVHFQALKLLFLQDLPILAFSG